jgi:putative transposase
MSHIPNQPHRRSIRLKGYDYSREGLYFVTICVQDRVCLFGKVEDGKMVLNDFGEIAQQELLRTKEVRPNVEIDSFVVMPNHVHFIIHIMSDVVGRGKLHLPDDKNNDGKLYLPDDENGNIEEGEFDSPLPAASSAPLSVMPHGTSQTVGAIVRGYKSAVTKQLNTLGFSGKLWQRNYFERIIFRSELYDRVVNYIDNNPVMWKEDKFYQYCGGNNRRE